MTKDFGQSIKTAYFYLFSAVGVILLIVGVFKLTDYTVNKVFFDSYYLPYESSRCAVPAPVREEPGTRSMNENYVRNCEEELEQERKFAEISDISSSVAFLVVGGVLFTFHYRRARKLS